MPVSRANGIGIHYEKAGDGPALVLLHPIPYDLNAWLFQIAQFSSHFSTISIDLRGWGRSDKPVNAFTPRDMCNDIMGVLADEDIHGGAIVMGCSFGSKLALILALDHPDFFRAAILAGGISSLQHNLLPHIDAYRSYAAVGNLPVYHREALLRGVTRKWAETQLGRYLIDTFVERGANLNAESIVRVFEALIYSDLTPRLATHTVPTLIINGEHDSAFEGGARTASLAPSIMREIIPDVGHCSFLEDPQAFNTCVRQFLVMRGLWPDRPAP